MRPIILLLSLAVSMVTGCGRKTPVSATADNDAVAVKAASVTRESLPALIDIPATVRPAERAVISARLTGMITSLPWALGQEVNAGDLLLTLAAPEAGARVRQAQALLAEAERATDRERTLVAKGVNPPDNLRDAEDRLRFAQAGLAEVEALLAYASIRAPFAGVITEKPVLAGDLATPGLPLLTLESTARLRAEGTVPEQAATALRPGDRISVVLGDTTPAVEGTIEELSTAADTVSRSVRIMVALPAGSARSGQFARLQVAVGRAEVLLVPTATVTHFGQMERVFVVRDGRAVLRLVKTGREAGGRVDILSGLQAAETVLVNPPASLREGARVTVAP
jgi:RND family efflux transporter MFP subunit